MEKDLFQQFDNGSLAGAGQAINLGLCAWNTHKDFAGVYVKNLVSADQTNGLFTCHLVHIEPEHKIGLHTHPGSIDLHEVVKGSGICLMNQGEIHYVPGVMAVIARDEPHEVRAGEEGLFLFAKFITHPAYLIMHLMPFVYSVPERQDLPAASWAALRCRLQE